MFELSQDQQMAVNAAINWLNDWLENPKYDSENATFKIGGLAGTGKTTIIFYIQDVLKHLNIGFAAPTGRAANNMRRKGISSAVTCHRAIYNPQTKYDPTTGSSYFKFVRKTELEYDLMIVDEAPMVSPKMDRDLRSFKKPIIYIGDHGQLPPVEGGEEANLMADDKLNFKLEQIHRHAENMGIALNALQARAGMEVPYGSSQDGTFHKVKRSQLNIQTIANKGIHLICGFHKTRQFWNNAIREIYGLSHQLPKCNERIMVKENNYHLDIFRGQIYFLVEDSEWEGKYLRMKIVEDYDIQDYYAGNTELAKVCHFDPLDLDPHATGRPSTRKDVGKATFGYCSTVHASQGSEWPEVIFFDDGFGRKDSLLRKRLIYTALTRASKMMVWAF